MEYHRDKIGDRKPDIPEEDPRPEIDLADVAEPDAPTRVVHHDDPTSDPEGAKGYQMEEGIREHGDALHAFLRLPDTDSEETNLLAAFRECYIGSYESMRALFEATSDIRDCEAEVEAVSTRWGFDGLFVIDHERLASIAHAVWDIVEIKGTLYVFSK